MADPSQTRMHHFLKIAAAGADLVSNVAALVGSSLRVSISTPDEAPPQLEEAGFLDVYNGVMGQELVEDFDEVDPRRLFLALCSTKLPEGIAHWADDDEDPELLLIAGRFECEGSFHYDPQAMADAHREVGLAVAGFLETCPHDWSTQQRVLTYDIDADSVSWLNVCKRTYEDPFMEEDASFPFEETA